MNFRIFAVTLGSALVGCSLYAGNATAQFYDGRVTRASYVVPEEWKEGRTGVQPVIRSSETLEDAWRIALQNDERVKAGGWNVAAANQNRAAAYAEGRPSVTVGADCLALSEPISLAPPVVVGTVPVVGQGTLGFYATVSQPLYTAGRIDSEIAASAAEVSVNRSQLARTRLDIKMAVAETYVAVLRGRQVVEVTRSKVTSLKSHVQDVENRFQVDKASRNELLAAQVALADAQQQELRAENTLEMVYAAYNRSLGRNLTDAVNIVELVDNEDPPSVEELTRSALWLRPEIAEITAQATALREQAAAACSKNSPQVALRGGFVYQGDKYIEPNGIAGVALTAEWNLFDSGRAGHQATALSQKAEALMRMRKDAESAIALEVRQKWLEVQTAKQQIAFAKLAITQADENLRVVRDRYVQRLGNNTEVLDAETLRAQAYMNLHNSFYEAQLARLRLRRATGSL
jgi:outer membrane protein TolC